MRLVFLRPFECLCLSKEIHWNQSTWVWKRKSVERAFVKWFPIHCYSYKYFTVYIQEFYFIYSIKTSRRCVMHLGINLSVRKMKLFITLLFLSHTFVRSLTRSFKSHKWPAFTSNVTASRSFSVSISLGLPHCYLGEYLKLFLLNEFQSFMTALESDTLHW